MRYMLTPLMLSFLSLSPMSVLAQSGAPQITGCPPGVMPGQPGCGGSNDSSNDQVYTGPIWQDRYGALAASHSKLTGGAAENMPSERAARKEALKKCGADDCIIENIVRNGCHSVAVGPNPERGGEGVTGYGGAGNISQSNFNALLECKKGGAVECKVEYSACSLPVRVK